jgi:hypothetical protein
VRLRIYTGSAVELEESTIGFKPSVDRRPLVPEPLPVRLIAIEDASLMASAGLEVQLDEFYIGLLKLERDEKAPGLVYRADNFRVRFEVVEQRPERDSLRSLLVEVPRLSDIEHQIIDRKTEYSRQKGIAPGEERLVLQDPAGNWIEIVEYRRI